MFESDPSNNAVSKSMKTAINRITKFTITESSSRLKNYRENFNNEASQKLCEFVKKRMNVSGRP